MTEQSQEGPGDEQVTDLHESTPNAGGPEGASGGMGISSERVGPSGGDRATVGEKDTTEPPHRDQAGDLIGSDAEFVQGHEENPAWPERKSDYPSKDPRSGG